MTLRLALIALAGMSLAAQDPAQRTPMTPSDPHEKLAFFIGTWTIEEMAAEKYHETCDWMAGGRRHVVCGARWETPTGTWGSMRVFSYRPSDGAYLHFAFGTIGTTETIVGKQLPDGSWEFLGEEGSGRSRVRKRVRVSTKDANGGFRFIQQSATGGGAWSAEDVVNYRPIK